MNYYERIQKSLDYIEDNMEGSIELEIIAQKAYMSMKTTLSSLPDAWNEMGRWMALTNSKVAKRQWIEEWVLDNWNFPVREIKVLYPTDI